MRCSHNYKNILFLLCVVDQQLVWNKLQISLYCFTSINYDIYLCVTCYPVWLEIMTISRCEKMCVRYTVTHFVFISNRFTEFRSAHRKHFFFRPEKLLNNLQFSNFFLWKSSIKNTLLLDAIITSLTILTRKKFHLISTYYIAQINFLFVLKLMRIFFSFSIPVYNAFVKWVRDTHQ